MRKTWHQKTKKQKKKRKKKPISTFEYFLTLLIKVIDIDYTLYFIDRLDRL